MGFMDFLKQAAGRAWAAFVKESVPVIIDSFLKNLAKQNLPPGVQSLTVGPDVEQAKADTIKDLCS